MLDLLESAAKAGGEVLKKYFRQELTVTRKTSHQNLVTEADFESQDIIRDILVRGAIKKGIAKTDIGFIGEEGLNQKGTHLFIIDPLDGTTNFASNIPYFCVSIAYAVNGKIKSGVIFDPITKTIFLAEKGSGAYIKTPDSNTPLSIKFSPLENCVMDTHLSSQIEYAKKMIKVYGTMHNVVRKIRSFGSIALSLAKLADNQFGIVVNAHAFLWDIAAAFIIIREAGGEITDFSGNPIQLQFDLPETTYQVIASHPKNISQVVRYIS